MNKIKGSFRERDDNPDFHEETLGRSLLAQPAFPYAYYGAEKCDGILTTWSRFLTPKEMREAT